MKLKEFIWPIIIFLLAIFLRVLWLDRVPGALGGDELHYILTIKSVALTGLDLTGNWNLFSVLLFKYPAGLPQAELSYFLLYPLVALTHFSLFTTRITFALISALSAILMYLVVEKLFDKKTGIIAGILFAINPWQVFIGRTTYEVAITPFFILAGIYFLISQKGSKIFWSIPFFVLAFYSYIGTKVILLPISIIVCLFVYYSNNKKFAKEYMILNLILLVFTVIFAFSAMGQSQGRVNQLFLPTSPVVAHQVDSIRSNSMSPQIVLTLLDNKITVYIEVIAQKFFGIFSPNYLFVSSDPFLALYNHGLFYWVDSLFLILGVAALFAKKKKSFVLFSALIIVSTIPQLIYSSSTQTFSPHLVLLFTFLIIPIAYGISSFIDLFNNQKVAVILIAVIYLLSIVSFLNIYFFEYPRVGNFDFASREIDHYIKLASESGQKVNVYVQGPQDAYRKYIYYSDSVNFYTISEIKNSFVANKYTLGNVSFLSCGKFNGVKPGTIYVYQSNICPPLKKVLDNSRIRSLMDISVIYQIYNDNICTNPTYHLKLYTHDLKISDFSVEILSTERFCEAFVNR